MIIVFINYNYLGSDTTKLVLQPIALIVEYRLRATKEVRMFFCDEKTRLIMEAIK
jgi:hypothetical protein